MIIVKVQQQLFRGIVPVIKPDMVLPIPLVKILK